MRILRYFGLTGPVQEAQPVSEFWCWVGRIIAGVILAHVFMGLMAGIVLLLVVS